MQSHVAIAADRTEGDEAAVGHRIGCCHMWLSGRRDRELERAGHLGGDPLQRLLLFASRHRLLRGVMMICVFAADEVDGHVAEWQGLVNVTVERQAAGTENENHRRQERHGRADHPGDRKSTRLNSSHTVISYAVFCLKKKKK